MFSLRSFTVSQKTKQQKITSTGVDVEKLEGLHAVRANIKNIAAATKNSMQSPQNIKK